MVMILITRKKPDVVVGNMKTLINRQTGWWSGTWMLWLSIYVIFPYTENSNPNWRTHIVQRGRSTTNQIGYPYLIIPLTVSHQRLGSIILALAPDHREDQASLIDLSKANKPSAFLMAHLQQLQARPNISLHGYPVVDPNLGGFYGDFTKRNGDQKKEIIGIS